MKIFRIIIVSLFLVGISYISGTIFQTETESRRVKGDLIELSRVKYGLFSVDEWKKVLAGILTKKIEGFHLDGASREMMRDEISGFLDRQILELRDRYYEENRRQQNPVKRAIGGAQNLVATVTDIFGTLRENVPVFTDEILSFMDKPQNREALRDFILSKMNDYADRTFADIDSAEHNEILARYGYEGREQALNELRDKVNELEERKRPFEIGLVILAVLTGLIIAFSKNISRPVFLILTVICFIYLLGGLLMPMIEIDARISEMSFSLLGEPVAFHDQVLYYKSKSILEVVALMVTQSRPDLWLVGILVLTFSVVFPLAKLISTVLFLWSERIRTSKFFHFILFRTGKWSMADVMVIAIFMAYIGFTGIVTEQLLQIEKLSSVGDILTTNNSNLQIGFFAFASFAILSLLVSHKLQYSKKETA